MGSGNLLESDNAFIQFYPTSVQQFVWEQTTFYVCLLNRVNLGSNYYYLKMFYIFS